MKSEEPALSAAKGEEPALPALERSEGSAAKGEERGGDAGRFGLGHLVRWLIEGDSATRRQPVPLPGAFATPFSTVTMSSLPDGYPPMQPGGLFIAIRTERRDGHDFTANAFEHGARAALLARVPEHMQGAVQRGEAYVLDFRTGATRVDAVSPAATSPVLLLVDDPLPALHACAAWWRRQFQVPVLAVAGSVGKTTTKELLANVVERRFRLLRTPGNFNNEYGLPFTLLQITPEHERVVLEIGISDVGEMAGFAHLAAADVAVMTRIAPEHLHQLKNLDTVEREEGIIVEQLSPQGVAVLNADDPRVARMAERTAARVVRFGELVPGVADVPAMDVYATEVQSLRLEGLRFRLHGGGRSETITTPLVGRHFVTASLAAAAAAFEAGCTWEDVIAGLARAPSARRMEPRALPGGVTLLDDAYNASPDSMCAALDLLASLPGRHIAVLGDMLELGEYAEQAHRDVGGYVPGHADALITVGELGRVIAEAARAAGFPPAQTHTFPAAEGAIAFLRDRLAAGDNVLVKASRGMHLDAIVVALTGDPRAAGH